MPPVEAAAATRASVDRRSPYSPGAAGPSTSVRAEPYGAIVPISAQIASAHAHPGHHERRRPRCPAGSPRPHPLRADALRCTATIFPGRGQTWVMYGGPSAPSSSQTRARPNADGGCVGRGGGRVSATTARGMAEGYRGTGAVAGQRHLGKQHQVAAGVRLPSQDSSRCPARLSSSSPFGHFRPT